MLDAHPILTLVPPFIAILLVVITKKVVVSLGAGVLVAGLFIVTRFVVTSSASYIYRAVGGVGVGADVVADLKSKGLGQLDVERVTLMSVSTIGG